MQYRTLCGLSAALIIASSIAALETTHIDLREGSTNDGTVSISRARGELLFDDAATSPPVSLQTLLSVTSDHSTLTGLESDSHLQYLNEPRHDAVHDAAFNDALPVSPDGNGNTTVGGHVSDTDIHLERHGNEVVDGEWFFDGTTEFGSGTVYWHPCVFHVFGAFLIRGGFLRGLRSWRGLRGLERGLG